MFLVKFKQFLLFIKNFSISHNTNKVHNSQLKDFTRSFDFAQDDKAKQERRFRHKAGMTAQKKRKAGRSPSSLFLLTSTDFISRVMSLFESIKGGYKSIYESNRIVMNRVNTSPLFHFIDKELLNHIYRSKSSPIAKGIRH